MTRLYDVETCKRLDKLLMQPNISDKDVAEVISIIAHGLRRQELLELLEQVDKSNKEILGID